MKTKTKTIQIKALPVGALFYLPDSDLPGGVNTLTAFRRTRLGYTNCVTRKRVTFASLNLGDRIPVVPR